MKYNDYVRNYFIRHSIIPSESYYIRYSFHGEVNNQLSCLISKEKTQVFSIIPFLYATMKEKYNKDGTL